MTLAEIDALIAEHGTLKAAAAFLGIAESSLRGRKVRALAASERGENGTLPVIPGFAIARTSAQFGPRGEVQKEWVTQKPAASELFDAPPDHAIKGVSALVDANGRTIQQWIKTREQSTDAYVKAIHTAFDRHKGKAQLVPAPAKCERDLLQVYPVADHHLGMRAWALETGENYDLDIAAKRLRACMGRLVAQSPASKQAVIVNLGDYYHADDQRNMTPRSGHILDVDGRYFKVLTTGVQLMIDCIELALAKHQTVLVRNVPGNHDPHASIALTVALKAFFNNNKRVTIDADPSEWFFHRFGQTLIGAHHGHRAKPQNMAMTMACLRREDWGATRYHWLLFGHIHHETAKEVGDVRCESFQTLAAKDAYAAGSGYCSGQSISSITLHREDGEIGRHRINLTPALRAAA
jgi:predicted phosphodiesterase